MKKSMRTFFVTLAALCVCCCTVSFLTACNDDDDAPKVNGKIGTLRVDINIKEVYKQMDYLNEAQALLDSQRVIGAAVLIYDEGNKLVRADLAITSKLDTVSLDLPDLKAGTYTVLAVQQMSGEDKIGLWRFKDYEDLTTFRVMSDRFPLPGYAILAIDRQKVTLDGDATITLTPQSMGSLVLFAYMGLPEDKACEEVFLSTTNRARGLWMDPARQGDDQLWRDEDAAEGLPYYLAQIKGEQEGQRPPKMGWQEVFTLDRGTQRTGMGFSDDDYIEETIVDFEFQPGNHYYFLYDFDRPEGQRWGYGKGIVIL